MPISAPFTGRALGAPGWVIPGAMLDMDFENARYWGASPADLVCSRASQGFSDYGPANLGRLGTFEANVPRITDQGLMVELAVTNLILRSREFTNAAWTATNVTVAQTSEGADGTANGAARVTATAANGTLLQALTLASASRTFSIYVRRVTGTGTVELTQDGAAFTDRSGVISSTNWTQIILTATQANPTLGIRLGTNGDAVDVDFAQHEAGAISTSPIVTTSATATRNADVVTMKYRANLQLHTTLFVSALHYGLTTNTSALFGFSDGSVNNRWLLLRNSSGQPSLISTVGGTGTSAAGGSWTNGTPGKIAGALASGSMRQSFNGAAIQSGAPANLPSGMETLIFGQSGAGAGQPNAFIRRCAIVPTNLPDGMLIALAA